VSDDTLADALDVEGPAAPPRQNGELVFQAPWESRVFGVTMALFQRGAFDWEEFRELLIDEIGKSDRQTRAEYETVAPVEPVEGEDSAEASNYYASWHAALERLLAQKGLCASAELDDRYDAFAARPAGHEHGHEH
jgi:nitrile hydratase accessory protein